ncbi:hypothetical protein [Pelosinus baikalensis]|uniref:Uncharacterized protein n=1 Tax=Pelosinus baikalensis TaxID=2892015 RepID=A0ABS8HVI4_9FIRM|nr:hypothetical protein [Pelosinus baikalensis]MCC5467173.1 hypothetical protein [Pelosinus baikalensis]
MGLGISILPELILINIPERVAAGSEEMVVSIREIETIGKETSGQTQTVSAANRLPWKRSPPPAKHWPI